MNSEIGNILLLSHRLVYLFDEMILSALCITIRKGYVILSRFRNISTADMFFFPQNASSQKQQHGDTAHLSSTLLDVVDRLCLILSNTKCPRRISSHPECTYSFINSGRLGANYTRITCNCFVYFV